MTVLVQEYFPDTPDKCVDCPRLENAAQQLDLLFRSSAGAAELVFSDQPSEPDEARDIAVSIRGYAGEKAAQDLPVVVQMAKRLVRDCEIGTIWEEPIQAEETLVGRWMGRLLKNRSKLRSTTPRCTTTSPVSYFSSREG